MQLGFVSAILPELSLEEVFGTAQRIGYECVEVMCWPVGKADRRYAGVTHIDVNSLDAAGIETIHSLVERTGVAISGLGYYPNALSPNAVDAENAVRQIYNVIDACAVLEINVMNTFIGRDWTQSVENNWLRFLETWKPIVRHAEEKGILIAIENCPMIFTEDEWPGGKNLAHSPAIWRRMFEELGSPSIGLNYDPSHPVWLQMDHLAPLEQFTERIFHLHAKDLAIDQDKLNQVGIMAPPLEYHSPKLPGSGDIDWKQFLGVVRDVGYDGAICVEGEDREYEDSLESRLVALEKSYAHLRPLVSP
ncbi:MAG: AP endonuclease [Planctomycetaceae bacterium]|nr:AP endonuclease [Planctomycetaceae bacterium]